MIKLFIGTLIVCLPLKKLQLTSSFGCRVHPLTGKLKFHKGVDLKARHDTVYAMLDGKVIDCNYNPAFGVYIKLTHGQFSSSYGHLSQLLVWPGDTIYAGSPIGITGATGKVTGEHLHFSISFQGKSLDPMDFLIKLINQHNHE